MFANILEPAVRAVRLKTAGTGSELIFRAAADATGAFRELLGVIATVVFVAKFRVRLVVGAGCTATGFTRADTASLVPFAAEVARGGAASAGDPAVSKGFPVVFAEWVPAESAAPSVFWAEELLASGACGHPLLCEDLLALMALPGAARGAAGDASVLDRNPMLLTDVATTDTAGNSVPRLYAVQPAVSLGTEAAGLQVLAKDGRLCLTRLA
jgi:hypothetical protein